MDKNLAHFSGQVARIMRQAVQFLICRDCGAVQELEDEDVRQILGRVVSDYRFQADSMVVEVSGPCAGCVRS